MSSSNVVNWASKVVLSGWALMWLLITKHARALSVVSFTSSLITDKISNLDKIGSVSSTLSLKFLVGSYHP